MKTLEQEFQEELSAKHTNQMGMTGLVIAELRGPDGLLKDWRVVKNLITDAGDLYIATRVAAAVVPATPGDATKVTGMKLGTGATAVAKNGAGAALVSYLTASNLAFDATWPQVSNLGAGLGVTAGYKTTWGAGVATNGAITEVVIVNDAGTNLTSTGANTISRALFGSAINKGALDILAVTWLHKALGV